ncbi:MAG: SIMPL domain-containing protein [Pedobacter sp.]|uniref:SIMPL domain-containing protein n=1 Tax=Pedobacter sp. TaxID=1411316 RepID=UPI0028085E94|nr:SIMPL domain-containing protein [Pedobacter sp.]MDQ8004667.1 SIMPL domain-containing protein [Pedobacter sp.]
MKRLFATTFLALVALFSLNASAQQVDLRKKISVTGTAETEVTPDIIYISISLKEYLKDGNSKKKVDITTLETQLYNAIQKAGLPKENLTIDNLSSWNYQTTKKKDPDFLASKQYRLKVTDLNKFNLVLEGIDAKGIASTNIASYDYSKIESLKKELKIKALLAAKEKATYMVEALGDKLGSVLDIQDHGDNIMQPQPVFYRNTMMKTEMAMDAAQAPEIDFKKIKLSFTVNTVFEIK